MIKKTKRTSIKTLKWFLSGDADRLRIRVKSYKKLLIELIKYERTK